MLNLCFNLGKKFDSLLQRGYASKRVPMIKFRAGKARVATAPSGPAASQGAPAAAAPPAQGKPPPREPLFKPELIPSPPGSSSIQDWELPRRYSRAKLDSTEIEYINCGGPPLPQKKGAVKRTAAPPKKKKK